MKVCRRVLLAVVLLYAAGLVWGYFRLPWAAIKSLRDYRLIAEAPAVSLSNTVVSPSQLGYLRTTLPVSAGPVVPRVSVSVSWYAVVVARVQSGHYVGNTGAENRDALYFCIFGAWIPVYTYSDVMA